MTAYSLMATRTEFTFRDENGVVYRQSPTAEGINEDITKEFLGDYARLSQQVLNLRQEIGTIEIKFELEK